MWLDFKFVKANQDGRVVSVAVVIAVGVNMATDEREVLELDVGPSKDGAFWAAFLRSLVARGLKQGGEARDQRLPQGAQAQGRHRGRARGRRLAERCRVHFMPNALSLVPKAAQQMVGATIRTVFVQPDAESAREQWRRVADSFRGRFPRLARLMDEAEEAVLT